MKKAAKNRKYFAPQSEDRHYKCEFPGCSNAGEFRAPKDKSLKEYHWFCLEHVQAYNSEWNYYSDEENTPKEEPFHKAKMHFKGFHSKVNYQFGYKLKDDFAFFGDYGSNFSSKKESYFTVKEKDFLEIMELEESGLSIDTLKKQYKKMVKKCHPDLHQNDKDAEEKFKNLTEAYKALLEKLS